MNEAKTGGVGFGGLLLLLFIGLKLTGYIDWSWWLVLIPLWGPLALIGAIILIGLAVYGLVVVISAMLRPKRRRFR